MKTAYVRALVLATCIFALMGIVKDARAQGILYGAKVVKVRVDASGKGMVFFDSNIGATPASCANSYTHALAFATNTAGGKAILALALSSKATDSVIPVLVGTGACSIYSGYVEDWSYSE